MLKNKKGFVFLFLAVLMVILVAIYTLVLYGFLHAFLTLSRTHEVSLQNYYYAGLGIERGRWYLDNVNLGGNEEDLYINRETWEIFIDDIGDIEDGNDAGYINVRIVIAAKVEDYTITATANPGTADKKVLTAEYLTASGTITAWKSGGDPDEDDEEYDDDEYDDDD